VRSTSRLACVLALVSAALPRAATAAPPDPKDQPKGIAAFARFPQFSDARISPSGKYLALIVTENGRNSLVVMDLAKREILFARKQDGETMVGAVHWVADDWLVAELVDQDSDRAFPVFRGEIWAASADGTNDRLVFGYHAGDTQTSTNLRKAEPVREWGFFLSRIEGDPRRFLVESTPWDDAGDVTNHVYRVDAHTGVRDRVATAPFANAWYFVDERGDVRCAVARTPDLKARVALRQLDGTWKSLEHIPSISDFRPIAFSRAADTLYVSARSSSGYGLFAVPLAGGAPRALAQNPAAPPAAYLFDRETNRPIAVAFEPDLPSWEFVNPEHPLARSLSGLLDAYPGDQVRLLGTTADQKHAVAHVYSDRNPGLLLLVDVEKNTADPIARNFPWLHPDDLVETVGFHISATDGFRIHGYLTSPKGASPSKPPPLVVLTHGGPHFVRDHWGFDPEVQLLASQGFAVLQVNYRGSGGYGDAYQEAGYRHWGDRMIQDIVDATRFALRKGYGDPARVCAYGGSFGAYASLQAAILAPDLFRCSVGYAGLYDLSLYRSDLRWFAGSRVSHGFGRIALGDDEAALRSASPAYNADKVKAKVLLVHGGQDKRVPIEHAEKMRAALEKAGNPPEWLVEPKEGHGFYDQAARERFFEKLVAFLKANTAPAPATPAR
jgi:dipeptidyl aminopeptidase/acylaminoacyl peptidase